MQNLHSSLCFSLLFASSPSLISLPSLSLLSTHMFSHPFTPSSLLIFPFLLSLSHVVSFFLLSTSTSSLVLSLHSSLYPDFLPSLLQTPPSSFTPPFLPSFSFFPPPVSISFVLLFSLLPFNPSSLPISLFLLSLSLHCIFLFSTSSRVPVFLLYISSSFSPSSPSSSSFTSISLPLYFFSFSPTTFMNHQLEQMIVKNFAENLL